MRAWVTAEELHAAASQITGLADFGLTEEKVVERFGPAIIAG